MLELQSEKCWRTERCTWRYHSTPRVKCAADVVSYCIFSKDHRQNCEQLGRVKLGHKLDEHWAAACSKGVNPPPSSKSFQVSDYLITKHLPVYWKLLPGLCTWHMDHDEFTAKETVQNFVYIGLWVNMDRCHLEFWGINKMLLGSLTASTAIFTRPSWFELQSSQLTSQQDTYKQDFWT